MSAEYLTYRKNAATARSDADKAILQNVKDRCLRAEAAWLLMADRFERIHTARQEREARPEIIEIALL